ncbi:MAG: hypothetical protein COW30_16450 [Rhodospirillales bacterium CG15_BIG_FIL_POST_REV_8_21_14_020_66_15]|nr:MAG: hypothetical protein COW30_16450 [Rhodospirillales bacterium CG15_BIG_FIL_POST_REV_8_21_14_020_66_15]
MSQVHHRILTAALSGLEEEQAVYFADIAEKLGEDPRTERMPNLVYLVLADTVRFMPAYLAKKEFINRLFRFVDDNHRRLARIIYDPAFLTDKMLLASVTGDFVAEVVEATLVQYAQGGIDTGERVAHRMTFDESGGALDFPYVDDEDEDD